MGLIWTLAAKDLRLLAADKVGAFFVVGYPLLFILFFGYVMGSMYAGDEALQPISVAVVDEDRTDASRQLFAALAASESLRPELVPNRTEGEGQVLRGRRAVCIVIPPGFQEDRDGLFAGRVMRPEVIVDPARPMESAMTQGLLQAALFRQVQTSFTDPQAMRAQLQRARAAIADEPALSDFQRLTLTAFLGASEQFFSDFDFAAVDGPIAAPATQPDPAAAPAASQPQRAAWQPFQLTVRNAARSASVGPPRVHNAFSIVVPQGMLWGVMACAATFATALVSERTRGTLPRLTVAPLARWQILAGKGLACILATLGVMLGMLALAYFVFGVRPDSPGLLALAVACIAVAIMGVMMLFAALGRSEAAVGGLSYAVIVIMAMLGGGMIPLVAMSGFMRTASGISIFRWAIEALDGAIWRGYSLADMLLPCTVLLAIGVVGFALGTRVFRWTR